MRTRTGGSLAALGLIAVAVAGCDTASWTTQCSSDPQVRRCEIAVSGTKFQDLPFPVSGPVLGRVPDRFRLERASAGGSATFSAGGTAGGTRTCERGQRVDVGDSRITCTEVGDTALRFVIERDR